MLKKTLLTLGMCLLLTGTALAGVNEKIDNGSNHQISYPFFTFTNQKAATRANNFIEEKVFDTLNLLEDPIYVEVSTSYKVIKETDKYVSITFTTANYTGGAHDMYYTYGLVFDKKTGKRLPYTAFADKISKENLQKGIADGTLPVFTADLKTRSSAPFLKDLNNFSVSKNYILAPDDHVYLMYQPYELDCYAAGVTYVKLPLKQ